MSIKEDTFIINQHQVKKCNGHFVMDTRTINMLLLLLFVLFIVKKNVR